MKPMRTLDAMDMIVKHSGLTRSELSRRLGKNRKYISAYYSRGLIPRVDTFATIIKKCDYDLIARNRLDKSEILLATTDDYPDIVE